MGRWGVLALFGAGFLVLGAFLLRVFSPSSGENGGSWVHSPTPEQPRTGLGRASQAEMPKILAGVFLEMDEAQLRAVRPVAKRNEAADNEGFYVFDESLGGSGQALYLFARHSHLLARVQLARQLSGVTALSARIRELQTEYGPMTGVWDCGPLPGQLPTRRFSWLRGPVGMMDVVLLLGERVLATLYVAARADILTSLTRAACVPTPPERFSKFPAVPASKAD